MKKIIAIICITVCCLAVFSGCENKKAPENTVVENPKEINDSGSIPSTDIDDQYQVLK